MEAIWPAPRASDERATRAEAARLCAPHGWDVEAFMATCDDLARRCDERGAVTPEQCASVISEELTAWGYPTTPDEVLAEADALARTEDRR